MKNLPKFNSDESPYPQLSVELVDGMWPEEPSYISITIPYEWLTDDAFEEDDDNPTLYISFAELLNDRLLNGICPLAHPSRQEAMRTISACRRYADELEQIFVNGEDAYDQDEARAESDQYMRDNLSI